MRSSDLVRKQTEVSSVNGAAHAEGKKMRISDLVKEQMGTSTVSGAVHIRREKNIDFLVRFNGKPAEESLDEKREDYAVNREEAAAEALPKSEMQPTPKVMDTVLPVEPAPSVSPATIGVKELYAEARDYMTEFRQKVLSSGKGIGPGRSLKRVERIVESPRLIDEMYALTLLFGHADTTFVDHSVNNMVYSLMLGMRMNYPPRKLVGLALAALHHDVGMFLIPEQILNKKQRLNSAELAEIRKHPGTGRNLLEAYDAVDPEISRAVYEHHERESMQGYPEGIGNGKICEYAKIIGICDSYEAMTHYRPHKKAMEQYVSVLELARTKDLLFDPRIVKVFLDVITIYPIGTYVRLNNSAIGVVVSTNPDNPFRPVVRIVRDGQGNKVSGEQIDLAQTNILNIVTGVPATEASA